MEKQMEFMFNEGGMMDSGMDIDPISGNDIPPGSLDDEVSDQIDAKLSEGEYVLPADVVQFYGLEKIESWVNKAKEKLGELDKAGRIGGEPIPEEGVPQAEEELPFPVEDLAYVDDGVPAEKAFAEGGLAQPSFNPAQYGFGGLGGGSSVSTRKYIGPDGAIRTFTFVNGEPIQFIPQGFTPYREGQETPAPSTAAPDTSVSGGSFQDEQERQRKDDRVSKKPYTPEEWSVDDFEKYMGGSHQNIAKGITSVMGVAAPPIGMAMRFGTRQTEKRAISELQKRIADEATSSEDRERYTKVLREISDGKDEEERGGLLSGFGDNIKDFLGLDGSAFGRIDKRPQTTTRPSTPSSRPSSRSSSTNDNDSGATRRPAGQPMTSSPRPQARPTTNNGPVARNTTAPRTADRPAPSIQDTPTTRGRGVQMAKGGFVKRRK